MQLQLQKKLQQKTEVNRDHKRKIQVRLKFDNQACQENQHQVFSINYNLLELVKFHCTFFNDDILSLIVTFIQFGMQPPV